MQHPTSRVVGTLKYVHARGNRLISLEKEIPLLGWCFVSKFSMFGKCNRVCMHRYFLAFYIVHAAMENTGESLESSASPCDAPPAIPDTIRLNTSSDNGPYYAGSHVTYTCSQWYEDSNHGDGKSTSTPNNKGQAYWVGNMLTCIHSKELGKSDSSV